MFDSKINDLKTKALSQNVPIISDEGLLVLLNQLKNYDEPNVLEIGSAIGYSAIMMAYNNAFVTTIERNEESYLNAIDNIKSFELNDKINVIFADATIDPGLSSKFDIIFIDAAKAQYKVFFNTYEKYLKPEGVIICDNLNFHNLNPNEVSRSTRQLLRKINDFKDFLSTNDLYQTTFTNVGDGMSISRKVIK